MSWCQVCVGIHGDGCTASYRDDDGRELCVFCYDGLVCPIQKKILARAAAAGAGAQRPMGPPTLENTITLAGAFLQQHRARTLIVGRTETNETEEGRMATQIRMCAEEGCDKKLSNNNATPDGKCQAHTGKRSHHAPAAIPAEVVHSPADESDRSAHAGENGRAHPPSNGHDLALEERVALVMGRIPLQDRLAFISRWISGEA